MLGFVYNPSVYNPGTEETGTEISGIQGHPWLHSQFEVRLSYRKFFLKATINGQLQPCALMLNDWILHIPLTAVTHKHQWWKEVWTSSHMGTLRLLKRLYNLIIVIPGKLLSYVLNSDPSTKSILWVTSLCFCSLSAVKPNIVMFIFATALHGVT